MAFTSKDNFLSLRVDSDKVASDLTNFPLKVALNNKNPILEDWNTFLEGDLAALNNDWTASDSANQLTYNADNIGFSGSGVSTETSYIYSATKLSGDFDITVDFDIVTAGNGQYLVLLFWDSVNEKYYELRRYRVSGSERYYANSSDVTGNIAYVSDTSGKLRIVRSSGTITAFYYTTQWEFEGDTGGFEIGSSVTADLEVRLYGRHDAGETVESTWSNYSAGELTANLVKKVKFDLAGTELDAVISREETDGDDKYVTYIVDMPNLKASTDQTIRMLFDADENNNTDHIAYRENADNLSAFTSFDRVSFNAGLNDLKNNSNDGTLTNGAVLADDGRVQFDGDDDYLALPSDITIPTASNYTVEIEFEATAFDDLPGCGLFVNKGDAVFNYLRTYAPDLTHHQFDLEDNNNIKYSTNDTEVITFGEKNLLSLVFNASSITFYFNGSNIGTTAQLSNNFVFDAIGEGYNLRNLNGYVGYFSVAASARNEAWHDAMYANVAAENLISISLAYETDSRSTGSIQSVQPPLVQQVVVATGATNSLTIGKPPQNQINFNGADYECLYFDGDGTSGIVPKIAYSDKKEMSFNTPQSFYDGTIRHADQMCITNRKGASYDWLVYFCLNESDSDRLVSLFTRQDGANTWVESFYGNDESSISATLDKNPAILTLQDRYFFIGGVDSATGKVYATRSAITYYPTSWETLTELGDSDDGFVQFVDWVETLEGVGVFYTLKATANTYSTLYFREWNSTTEAWESAETVATDVRGVHNFRGSSVGDGSIFATWKEDTTGNYNLQYRVRSDAGSWGTETNFCTDIDNQDDGLFTSCADITHGVVYVAYYNGTRLVYRTWNGSAVSSATSLTDAVILQHNFITAPEWDHERIAVMYHTSDDVLRLAIIPIDFSDLVADSNSIPIYVGYMDHVLSPAPISVNNKKSLVSFTARGYKTLSAVYDHDSATYITDWIETSERYNDMHSAFQPFFFNDYLWVKTGGRTPSDASHGYEIHRSRYKFLDPRFGIAMGKENWIDMEFPSAVFGRGYTKIVIDNNNVLHALFITSNTAAVLYNWSEETGWSSSQNFITTGITGKLYYGNMILDSNGNLAITWTDWPDYVTYSTNLLRGVTFFTTAKLQSDFTYKFYDKAGNEIGVNSWANGDPVMWSGIFCDTWNGVDSDQMASHATSTVVAVGDTIQEGGRVYKIMTGDNGTTAGTKPTFATGHRSETVDGTATWTEFGQIIADKQSYRIQWLNLVDSNVFLSTNFYNSDNTVSEVVTMKWTGAEWEMSTNFHSGNSCIGVNADDNYAYIVFIDSANDQVNYQYSRDDTENFTDLITLVTMSDTINAGILSETPNSVKQIMVGVTSPTHNLRTYHMAFASPLTLTEGWSGRILGLLAPGKIYFGNDEMSTEDVNDILGV